MTSFPAEYKLENMPPSLFFNADTIDKQINIVNKAICIWTLPLNITWYHWIIVPFFSFPRIKIMNTIVEHEYKWLLEVL